MKRLILSFLMIGFASFPRAGLAVIVAGGDGTQNTNSPVGGQGWDYVGRIDKPGVYSSVTYISNNWFITANHIKVLDNPTGVILGGSSYPIDPNSWTRLKNSASGNADLMMFRVIGNVGLSGLTVRTSTISNGSGLTMIGNGRNREVSETSWNALWAEGGHPPEYSGYKWAVGATKRWGTNTKQLDVGLQDDGFGITDMYYTDFDKASTSSIDQAQGATYDSGGGVFYNNGAAWELAGIMLTTSGYSGQPGSTAVYGNRTYIADMQYYASQIFSTAQILDIDEDGIPDEWEYTQTGSTTGVVASADQDGDGFTGEEEWIADTDPTDSSSYFSIRVYSNATSLVFPSSTNREYQIDYRLNLADTNESWITEVSWFAPVSTQTVKTVTAPVSNCFFRIKAKLP